MTGKETLFPMDVVGYPGSVLITNDGSLYLHPRHETYSPHDSIELPAYRANVLDFSNSFEELGPSPRGHVFEGPESGSIFVVNNQDLHSKVYYREIPTSDYEEVQLSAPDLGKIKYIKYDDLGQMYIATEHSHFYKADLLASSTKEIEAPFVRIFPNPTADFIKIEAQESIQKIELYDIQGRRMNISFKTSNIDLSFLENGIYILKVILKDGQDFTDKVVKL